MHINKVPSSLFGAITEGGDECALCSKPLHFEGYIDTKIKDGANGFQFWRCQNHKAGFPARATSEERSVVVRKEHDHPSSDHHSCC